MIALKIKPVGNSLGIILSKEVLNQLNVTNGDTLFLTQSPDGYRLTPYDPEFEEQMVATRAVMKRRRGVLRALAE